MDVVGPAKHVVARVKQLTLVRAVLRYLDANGALLADSVTYRTLFGVFAGLLLGFSAAGLWLAGNPEAWRALVDAVDNAIPGLVGSDGLVDPDDIEVTVGLSVAGILSLAGLVAAAIGAISSLRIAIRLICHTASDDVFFVWVMLRNLALAIGVGAALVVSAAVTVLGTAGLDAVVGWLGIGRGDAILSWGSRVLAIIVTFALDAVAIAALFRVLSGLRPPASALWRGALLGAAGLTALQQLSGLFVGGAANNPLLASFASLIALLLWINLSAQVILVATSYICTLARDGEDRERARGGRATPATP
ncbi:MAG: YihY/virulence factor BrkB family protein [Microbacterium sp.]